MNLSDVIGRVEEIEQTQTDPERAHMLEAFLHRDVLRAIANGEATDVRMVAAMALETQRFGFPRWSA